tara:strand:+ start:135 stop:800 length:666 start_codon:yes stop_codon:yes gene_type:complete
MLSSEDIKILEDYVRGNLNDHDKSNVENRLKEDPSFKKTFDNLVITKKAIKSYLKTEKIIDNTVSLMRKNKKSQSIPFYASKPYLNFTKFNNRYYRTALLAASVFIFVFFIQQNFQDNSLKMSKPPLDPTLKVREEYKDLINDIDSEQEGIYTVSILEPKSSEFNTGKVDVNSIDGDGFTGVLYGPDGKEKVLYVDWLDMEKGLFIAFDNDDKKYLLQIKE